MGKEFTADSLKSLLGNLGDVGRDKRAGVYYAPSFYTPDQFLNAYLASWACRKIVDIPASDAVSEWRDYKGEGADIEKIEAFENALQYQIKVEQALIKARLLGTGFIFIGTGAKNLMEPLDIEREPLKYLTVLSVYQVHAGEINYDPTSEFFGKPNYYRVNENDIHPSRFVVFEGISHPEPQFQVFSTIAGGGVSVLQPVFDAVKNSDSAQMNVASLLFEMNVDVIKSPDFLEGASNAMYEKRMTSRLNFGAAMKGINGMLLLDGEEEYERKSVSLANTPELIDKFIDVICGAADIPRTRFMGTSPGGLNSTGDGDLRNYYDALNTFQRLRLTPALYRLDELIIRNALKARPADFYYEWSPLWKLSDTDRATINKTTAEATEKYFSMGIIKPEAFAKAVVNRLVEDGTYPGLDSADAATLEEMQPEPEDDPEKIIATDMEPRSLYVRRDVLNADEILDWAKSVGLSIGSPTSADELHVTIVYSSAPVDWMKMGESWTAKLEIPEGGPRVVEQFGSAIVLRFTSFELEMRHDMMVNRGASHDFPDYQPHITITKFLPTPGFNVEEIPPYTGKIVLGPEIFEDIKK